jgi:hypothetical protein
MKSSLTEIAQNCRVQMVIYNGDRRNKFAFYTKFGGIDEPEFGYDRDKQNVASLHFADRARGKRSGGRERSSRTTFCLPRARPTLSVYLYRKSSAFIPS